jgi:hypothetical protein
LSLVLDEHRRYVADRSRVDRYAAALTELVRPGDTVVDLASGTGILGLLACRAGAARVIAVEMGPMAAVARALARANGFADRLEVRRCHSSELRLAAPADLIVSDQIGRFGFEADLLRLFADARHRLLKLGGRLIPSGLELMVAPVEHPRQFERVAYWGTRPAGFDFGSLHAIAANTGYPTRFAADQLLSAPATGCRIDLMTESPHLLRIDTTFSADRAGTFHGFGGWFSARLSPSTTVSNSPLDPRRTRRRQVFFPVARPVPVAKGDGIALAMQILPDEMIVSWKVDVTPRAGARVSFAHSTLTGMLLDPADVRRTDPSYRPRLTDKGVARQSVLELCDGGRTLAQIEAEMLTRHPALFESPAAAAVFVAEVVTRYTTDDT